MRKLEKPLYKTQTLVYEDEKGIYLGYRVYQPSSSMRSNLHERDAWETNADRVGFNTPEIETWKFPGPRMHWDVSLKMPIPFGTQGILYLADTAYNQGAFSLVPGFHNRIETWLHNLPSNVQPRNEDIYSLGVQPIVANAGDFIIWHHALPHGSSVNSSNQPRFVQYMNYEPLDAFKQDEWI